MRTWLGAALIQGALLGFPVAAADAVAPADVQALTGEWKFAGAKSDCRITFGHEQADDIAALPVDFASGPAACFSRISDVRYWRPESATRFELLDGSGGVLFVLDRLNARSATFKSEAGSLRLTRIGYPLAQN